MNETPDGHANGRRRLSRFHLAATIIYGATLATIVVLADLGYARRVFKAVHRVPYGDKICHFMLVGVLAYLFNRALRCRTFALVTVRILVGSAILTLVVIAEELSQLRIPSRKFDPIDLVANLAGILVFGFLARKIYPATE